MFNSIKGIISQKDPEYLYLENNGIEWMLEASVTTLNNTPPVGEEARIYTYMHHREDALQLFGFASIKERKLFLNLISVSGVGPKGARKILSGVSVDQIIQALENENVKFLSSLPGLGTKTAQKIILQLRGKLTEQEDALTGKTSDNEIVLSLSSMGFDKKLSAQTVKKLEKEEAIASLPIERREKEIIRRAIMELST